MSETLDARVTRLERALLVISELGGNLPDDRLTTRTGPNDAAARGLMYVQARTVAVKALCPTCVAYVGKMHPTHNGSRMCESGSIASGGTTAHCTCDTCF